MYARLSVTDLLVLESGELGETRLIAYLGVKRAEGDEEKITIPNL